MLGLEMRRAVRELDVIGLAEAAEVIGVSRGRARYLRQWGKLPEPSAELACGPVWHRGDFERWAADRRDRLASN